MVWEENSRICLHMQLIAILSRIGVYMISVVELEEKTGIDFFCNLPDDVETRVEKVKPNTDAVKAAWMLVGK